VTNPQTSNEKERETSIICPYCWKQFSVPKTESHLKGSVVTCLHCGKQSRLTGKTTTTRRWVLRNFAFLGAFAILGVIGIWIWMYGTIEHDIKALIALGGSVFFVVAFIVCVALTVYRVILIKTGKEEPKACHQQLALFLRAHTPKAPQLKLFGNVPSPKGFPSQKA